MQETTGHKQLTLHQLVQHDDEAFIRTAYWELLGRPHQSSESFYLNHLRNGVSKIYILDELLRSEEGRRHGARIRHFGLFQIVLRATALPIVGPVAGIVNRAMLMAATNGKTAAPPAHYPPAPMNESATQLAAQVVEWAEQFNRQSAQLMWFIDVKHQRLQAQLTDLSDQIADLRQHLDALERSAGELNRSHAAIRPANAVGVANGPEFPRS